MLDSIAKQAQTQQQTQISTPDVQRAVSQVQQSSTKTTTDVVKELAQEQNAPTKINSEQDVQELVNSLNKALAPLNTNLRFGVDSQDVFYVSVIESETSKMIRRFPAEQAADFLPKMQEVTGVLFDTKG